MTKKLVVRLSIVFLTLVSLAGVVALFMQTSMFKDWLKVETERFLNESVRGNCSIARISGNLFTYVEIDSLVCSDEQERIVQISKLSLNYNLLALLQNKLDLSQVVLHEPVLNLRQDDQDEWNITQAFASKDEPPAIDETRASGWRVSVTQLHLEHGQVDIHANSQNLPKQIAHLNARLGFDYSSDQIEVELSDLNFETRAPDFALHTIRTQMTYSEDEVTLQNIRIETDSSRLNSNIEVALQPRQAVDVSLTADPLALSELRKNFDAVQLYGSPRLRVVASGPMDSLQVYCEFINEKSVVTLSGQIAIVEPAWMYDLRLTADKLDLGSLTQQLELRSDLNFSLHVKGSGLDWPNLETDYDLEFRPSFLGDWSIRQSRIAGKIEQQQVNFTANVQPAIGTATSSLSGNVNLSEDIPAYRIAGNINSLDLQRYVAGSQITSNLNLRFEVKGAGIDYRSWRGDLSVLVAPSSINEVAIDSAKLDMSVGSGNIKVHDFAVHSPAARLNASGGLSPLREGEVRFKLDLPDLAILTHHFNMDSLHGSFYAYGKLSGALDSLLADSEFGISKFRNTTTRFDSIAGTVDACFSRSQNSVDLQAETHNLALFDIDSLTGPLVVHYTDSLSQFLLDLNRGGQAVAKIGATLETGENGYELQFDELLLSWQNQSWRLAQQEHAILYDGNDISFDNFALLYHGQIVELQGIISPGGKNDFRLHTRDLALKRLASVLPQPMALAGRLNLNLALRDTWLQPRIGVEITAKEMLYNDAVLGDIFLQASYTDTLAKVELLNQINAADTVLMAGAQLPLSLALSPFEWHLQQDKVAAHINLQHVSLTRIARLLQLEEPSARRFDGEIVFQAHLSKSLTAPRLTSRLSITNGLYYDVPFETLIGELTYDDSRLEWKGKLIKTATDSSLSTSGFLPIELSLQPFAMSVSKEKPVEFKLSTARMDLSFLQPFLSDVRNLSGTLVTDVRLHKSLNDLQGTGPFRIINGRFDLPEYGLRYTNANMMLTLQGRQLLFDQFSLNSSSGGQLHIEEGSLSLSKANIGSFVTRVRTKNFQISNIKKMQAKVDANVLLSGSIHAIEFQGDVTLVQASVYYPAWIEDEFEQITTDDLYFVIQPDTVAPQRSANGVRADLKETAPLTESEFYKAARGELTLRFPRNTWIRGEDANIEIGGDLQLVKQGPEFQLFGSVSTLRGYYELFGNRFRITHGELTFAGDTDFNPNLDIEATYVYRDLESETREQHTMQVFITGKKLEPQFRFTIDGEEAAHQDVVSLLLFGRRFEDLSFGQRNNLSRSTDLEKNATNFLTGQMLRRLTQTVSSRLQLDVFEVERGQGLGDARVNVGKYITPRVFVSVSQDFGAEGRRRVEVEYDLPKILFLSPLIQATKERQGETGVDVVWKIEW